MKLAQLCAGCRTEYAKLVPGFYAVIRGFIGPDRTLPEEALAEMIREWALDQANAQEAAKLPTKWLRKAISDAEVDHAPSTGGGSGFPKNKFGAPDDRLPRSLRSSLPPQLQTPPSAAAPVEVQP
jgi:hypothetical protein